MKVTTESIIKMLPFEDTFKKNMLDNWDGFSMDQKLDMTNMLWNAYAAIYEITFDKNMQQILLEKQEKDEPLEKDLYEQIKQRTEQELQRIGSEGATDVDLSATRQALEKLVNGTH